MFYEIDGELFDTLEDFFDEIGRVVIPGASWGRNVDELGWWCRSPR